MSNQIMPYVATPPTWYEKGHYANRVRAGYETMCHGNAALTLAWTTVDNVVLAKVGDERVDLISGISIGVGEEVHIHVASAAIPSIVQSVWAVLDITRPKRNENRYVIIILNHELDVLDWCMRCDQVAGHLHWLGVLYTYRIGLADLLISTNDGKGVAVGDKAAEHSSIVLRHIHSAGGHGNSCEQHHCKHARNHSHASLGFYHAKFQVATKSQREREREICIGGVR